MAVFWKNLSLVRLGRSVYNPYSSPHVCVAVAGETQRVFGWLGAAWWTSSSQLSAMVPYSVHLLVTMSEDISSCKENFFEEELYKMKVFWLKCYKVLTKLCLCIYNTGFKSVLFILTWTEETFSHLNLIKGKQLQNTKKLKV